MTTTQRQNHLDKVLSASLVQSDDSGFILTQSSDLRPSVGMQESSSIVSLSLTVEDAGIQSISTFVQKLMWQKAANLLSQPGLVMEGPCSSSGQAKCFVVASKSSSKPHIVQQQSSKNGQLMCKSSWPMWQSSKICSHCLAVAEFSGQLHKLIEWYKNLNQKLILLDCLRLTCQKEQEGINHLENEKN